MGNKYCVDKKYPRKNKWAPEMVEPGQPAMGNFVGWGGLGPVAIFLNVKASS